MFLRARPASETEVRIVGARAAALAKVSFDWPCGGTVPNFRIQVRRKGYRLSPRLTDESNNRRWLLEFTCHVMASAQHFEQCAELALLRNRGLGALAVTVLPIALARRAAATACAAVQSTAPLFRRW